LVARELLLFVPLDKADPDPALKPLLALDPRLVVDSAREHVLTSRGRNGSRDVGMDEDDPAADPAVDADLLIVPALVGAADAPAVCLVPRGLGISDVHLSN
jgi:hypothetical protein